MEIWIECPDCGTTTRLSRDSDFPTDGGLPCATCGRELGTFAKQALMREVATGIASQLVERENRSFFEELGERRRPR